MFLLTDLDTRNMKMSSGEMVTKYISFGLVSLLNFRVNCVNVIECLKVYGRFESH